MAVEEDGGFRIIMEGEIDPQARAMVHYEKVRAVRKVLATILNIEGHLPLSTHVPEGFNPDGIEIGEGGIRDLHLQELSARRAYEDLRRGYSL